MFGESLFRVSVCVWDMFVFLSLNMGIIILLKVHLIKELKRKGRVRVSYHFKTSIHIFFVISI